jgi:hypothetical protein
VYGSLLQSHDGGCNARTRDCHIGDSGACDAAS